MGAKSLRQKCVATAHEASKKIGVNALFDKGDPPLKQQGESAHDQANGPDADHRLNGREPAPDEPMGKVIVIANIERLPGPPADYDDRSEVQERQSQD